MSERKGKRVEQGETVDEGFYGGGHGKPFWEVQEGIVREERHHPPPIIWVPSEFLYYNSKWNGSKGRGASALSASLEKKWLSNIKSTMQRRVRRPVRNMDGGQWDGKVGKSACWWAWWPEPISQTRTAEEENQVPQIVLCSHVCWGVHEHTHNYWAFSEYWNSE